MKIRKVEISGFRVYNDPRDATFDFTTREGKTADFVSIYAPEGFGKTSFYDAVEWGITKSISRFAALKDDWNNSGEDSVAKISSLLQNRGTKRETYVKIETGENTFFTAQLGRQTNKDEIISADEFYRFILPLTKISSIISESDEAYRFKKLAELPVFEKAANYFNLLKEFSVSNNITPKGSRSGKEQSRSGKEQFLSGKGQFLSGKEPSFAPEDNEQQLILASVFEKFITKYNIYWNNTKQPKQDEQFYRKFYENFTATLKEYNENTRLFTECRNTFNDNREITKIASEFKRTKKYLKSEIDGFFNKSLINELYKKIDQNPDFTSVTFNLDLESDQPGLEILVKDNPKNNIENHSYNFSPAQVNSLSMAVFLASVLTSNKFDCIFIDDPILSKGSINQLATLDLLRSIAFCYNKQIIVSTSDQTIHSLFQKKMPPDLFNSKFLELESFGKLK